jgi:hypothetical protein
MDWTDVSDTDSIESCPELETPASKVNTNVDYVAWADKIVKLTNFESLVKDRQIAREAFPLADDDYALGKTNYVVGIPTPNSDIAGPLDSFSLKRGEVKDLYGEITDSKFTIQLKAGLPDSGASQAYTRVLKESYFHNRSKNILESNETRAMLFAEEAGIVPILSQNLTGTERYQGKIPSFYLNEGPSHVYVNVPIPKQEPVQQIVEDRCIGCNIITYDGECPRCDSYLSRY